MSSESAGAAPAFRPKKSVALSGTPAGDTAVCTVGQSGNDLHYRGYDIADLAAHCDFEEVRISWFTGSCLTQASWPPIASGWPGCAGCPTQ